MVPVVIRAISERTPQERKATLLANADIQAWIKDHRSPSRAGPGWSSWNSSAAERGWVL